MHSEPGDLVLASSFLPNFLWDLGWFVTLNLTYLATTKGLKNETMRYRGSEQACVFT